MTTAVQHIEREERFKLGAEIRWLGLYKKETAQKRESSTVHNEAIVTADVISAKVDELKAALGPLSGRARLFCTDECLQRCLRARNGNVRKAEKMLRDTLQWREKCKPEDIKWGDVRKEGETGKIYKTDFKDKLGRTVLVLSAGKQNTSEHESQILHLIYALENAVMTLDPGTEKMAWIIDFRNWTLKTSPPLKTAAETLSILQNHYPERLGVAVCYDPPKIFEAFFNVIKPFIDPVTRQKVKFIYPDEPKATTMLAELFDLNTLEESFGGRSKWEFNIDEYSARMEEDDRRLAEFWQQADGSA